MAGQLFINGRIYTLDQQQTICTGVFVKDGLIVDVGDAHQLLQKYKNEQTAVFDLEGSMLLPGLTDSHMHLVAHGQKLTSLDFSECRDALTMKAMLQEKIRQTPPGEWVIGRGWNENNFADLKIFTKAELDDMSKVHPILLTRICGHAFLANSLAFQIAGYDDTTPDPAGGKIVRDEQQRPTGLLLEQAGIIVQAKLPAPTYEELVEALRAAIKDCWRLGLVGCHTEDVRYCGGFNQTMALFNQAIAKEGNLFRAHQLVYHEYVDEMIAAGYSYKSGNDYVQVGAMKIFADGAMGGRSALLKEPYADDPSTQGVAIHTQEELIELVQKARGYDLPIAVHTIGDLALERVLDAIEKFPATDQVLDRIIHAQVLNQDLINRLQRLRLVVDIQPRFVAADFPWVQYRLGYPRVEWSYAWKRLLQAGIPCAGGSDAPIEPVDPLLGLHAAVTRVRPDEPFHEGYLPEQKLTAIEAVTLFTRGSAYAELEQQRKGSIEPGKLADFTVLDQDLFHLPADEWLSTQVKATVVNGQIVYQR